MDLTPVPPEPGRPEGAARPRGPDLADEFANVLAAKMRDLADLQRESARLDRALAAGEAVEIHQVMIAAAKAGLAMDLAVQIRNLALRAYTQVTQIR